MARFEKRKISYKPSLAKRSLPWRKFPDPLHYFVDNLETIRLQPFQQTDVEILFLAQVNSQY